MTKIIIGTTPTITYKFKVVDASEITVAILTIKERGVNIIELNLSDATVGEDSLSWTLTQEETLQLGAKTVTMMLNWKTEIDKDSMYNTPPCYPIYVCGLVLKWIKSIGGLEAMKEINVKKAQMLYDTLDNSKLFSNPVKHCCRSMMNVTFRAEDEEINAKFVKEATAAGFANIKGHRSVGGMRASIYNAMPTEGVAALCEFIKKFEAENA